MLRKTRNSENDDRYPIPQSPNQESDELTTGRNAPILNMALNEEIFYHFLVRDDCLIADVFTNLDYGKHRAGAS